jgi:hypothetical protein
MGRVVDHVENDQGSSMVLIDDGDIIELRIVPGVPPEQGAPYSSLRLTPSDWEWISDRIRELL